ncbi:protein LEAD-SENSITIVE 1-like [Humulus lupulus]|uniref:protein LEAD-SENSITIVE 1-like n=1 Tax=Humulus lupulus TaxID=3486 RepID=UPI002B415545|nr:protein LEAD-SENSITIVE 1-like [Humulus lupulus]
MPLMTMIKREAETDAYHVDWTSLKPGDHIYCYRRLNVYSHHGIYVGDYRVIHFMGPERGSSISSSSISISSIFFGEHCNICGCKPKPQGGVVKTCLECFGNLRHLLVFEYGVSQFEFLVKNKGTCSVDQSDDPDVVVRRATQILEDGAGFGEYDLWSNNCETFAVHCKTGKGRSTQALALLDGGVGGGCSIV